MVAAIGPFTLVHRFPEVASFRYILGHLLEIAALFFASLRIQISIHARICSSGIVTLGSAVVVLYLPAR